MQVQVNVGSFKCLDNIQAAKRRLSMRLGQPNQPMPPFVRHADMCTAKRQGGKSSVIRREDSCLIGLVRASRTEITRGSAGFELAAPGY